MYLRHLRRYADVSIVRVSRPVFKELMSLDRTVKVMVAEVFPEKLQRISAFSALQVSPPAMETRSPCLTFPHRYQSGSGRLPANQSADGFRIRNVTSLYSTHTSGGSIPFLFHVSLLVPWACCRGFMGLLRCARYVDNSTC